MNKNNFLIIDKRQIYNAAQFFRRENFLFCCAFPNSINYGEEGTGYEIYMRNLRLITSS